jgi:hypothetical protein
MKRIMQGLMQRLYNRSETRLKVDWLYPLFNRGILYCKKRSGFTIKKITVQPWYKQAPRS